MCVMGGDPEEIAVACSSYCVFVYQTTGRLQGTLKGHRSRVNQVVANSLRGMLLTCSEDACILWQLSNWSRLRSLFGEKNGFTSAQFTPSGRSILTCFSHGELYQWSLHNFSLEKTLTHAQGLMFTAITGLHTNSGDYCVGAGFDARLTIWESEGPAAPIGHIALQSQKVTQLVAIAGGKVIALGSAGGVEVADVRERTVKPIPVGDSKAVAIYADGKGGKMVAIDTSGAVRLFLGPNASQETVTIRPASTASVKSSVAKSVSSEKNDEAEVQIMSEKERQELEQTNPSDLRLKDLRNLLQKYGEFPDKYRLSIWQTILQLPNNEDSFAKLAGKGIHPAYSTLNEKYPIKSQKLFAQLQRTLSEMSYWSEVFAEAEVLPGIAFPIVALAGGQETVCFELLASLFLNWLQHWFEFFPNPPVSYIQACSLVLSRLDSQLSAHLQTLASNPGQVFWPLLSSLLTEVLTKEEWIVMMDHLVMEWEQPLLLLHFVTQYLLSYKSTLLSIRSPDDLSHFLHKQNPCRVVKLMKKARTALQRLDLNHDLPIQFSRRVPLLQGSYPTFTGYPQFEVNFQAEVRARIRQETDEALRKQNYLDDLASHMTDLEEKERQYRSQQEALLQLDHDRRTTAALSTAATLQEKRQIDQELRSKRLQQLRQVQGTIERSLDSQLEARKAELMRLEQEIANRRQQDQYFLEKKVQDEAVARLEFQSAQKLYELTRGRSMDDEQRKIREQIDVWKREQELKERLLHDQWALEDEERRLKLETIKERKLKEMESLTLANDRKKLEMQQQLQELEKEVRAQDVIRERKLRTIQEEEALRTAEALEKLTKAQTVVQQEEQMHFKTILAEERRAAERKTRERLELLEMERRKQTGEMQELEGEIEMLQKRQQRIEVEDRLAELRHEQEMKTLAEERQVQEMLLRIDEERRVKVQLEREMRMKEDELREKTEFQQVLRETEDRVLREERARFEEQRAELRRQQEEEESAKANAHNLKMETIIREREKQLLELTQARRQAQYPPPPEPQYPLPEEGRSRSAQISRVEESRSRGEEPRRDSPSYRDDLMHDTFSRNDEAGRFVRAEDDPSAGSPPHRSLSPGEEGERLVSHHDSEHKKQLRHVSSPGSYSVSSSYVSESSHVESYSSEVSGTPPLPDHYESSYSSELSSHTNSVTDSSGMSWSRSERSPAGEPVRRSHYY